MHCAVAEFATNQTLAVENGVFRILGCLELGRVAYQPSRVRKSNIGWGSAQPLFILDYLNLVVVNQIVARLVGTCMPT